MQKKIVAVICGGYTAEQNISLLSGDVVFRNIDRSKYEPFKVVIEEKGWFVEPQRFPVNLADFSFNNEGITIYFDCVFNAIHGSPGEDGKIQGYFDMHGIPYTNCGVATSALTFNKFWTKELVRGEIAMARDYFIRKDETPLTDAIQFIAHNFSAPVFVKPNNNGSSYGVSKVNDLNLLKQAVEEAFRFDNEVLIEEGISGTEVTCGVYRKNGRVEVLPLCEIVTGKHEFFDYTAKYTSGESDEIIPARITDEDAHAIRSNSEKIYNKLNCRGVVRIDYILREGIPYLLEVNTVPGLSEASIVPKMARADGMTLSQFFDILITECLRK